MAEPYIIFQVADAEYAVPSSQVQQVEMIDRITFVPHAPEFVEGVVYLRGQVVPVINLRKRFGLEKIPYDVRSRLIVIQVERRVVGLAVDTAREFLKVDVDQILPPPEGLNGPKLEYLSGVVSSEKRLLLIVDLPLLLNITEKEILAQDMTPAELGPENL